MNSHTLDATYTCKASQTLLTSSYGASAGHTSSSPHWTPRVGAPFKFRAPKDAPIRQHSSLQGANCLEARATPLPFSTVRGDIEINNEMKAWTGAAEPLSLLSQRPI